MIRLFKYLFFSVAFSSLYGESVPDFNPKSLSRLDAYEGNYLYRGNFPGENQTDFAYDQLVAAIKEDLQKSGEEVPDDFFLCDISLLNRLEDGKMIHIEKNFFEANKDKGNFLLYPLYGMLINPTKLGETERADFMKFSSIDGLEKLMEKIRQDLSSNKPTVVYIHCHSGHDRTGEASASYLMQFKENSFDETVQKNEEIAQRKINFNSMNGMRWYGYYLRDVKGIGTVGEID